MAARTLILLVILCLREGLWGGASISKVVRRRGIRAHAPMASEKKPVDQWDPSIKVNMVSQVKPSSLIGHPPGADARLVIHTETVPGNSAALVANGKGIAPENTKTVPQLEQKPVSNQDLASHTAAERGGDALDWSEAQNGSKLEQNDRALFLRMPDLGNHGNKIRFRPLVRSRVRPNLTILTTVVQGRRFPLDLPETSNLTENDGLPPVLAAKESPDRAAKAQLQRKSTAGLSSRPGAGRSRKPDPLLLGHGQSDTSISTEPGPDGAVTPGLVLAGAQTARPDSSLVTNPDSDSDRSVQTHWSQVGKATLYSGDRAEPWVQRQSTVHTTLTVQSEGSWNTVSSALQTDLPLPPVVKVDPQAKRSRSSGREGKGKEPESEITLDSMKGEAKPDSSRVLKLQPNPDPDWEKAENSVTVDSWLENRGLVFEEEEDGQDQGGAETRSRSRRSWIWNQFFVIEEYSGPEPVLIGRQDNDPKHTLKLCKNYLLHTDMDRGDGRTKYILRGEGAGSVFVIDEKTGNIHVTKPLDREEKDEYRLIATATDRQTERALEPSSQFIIRVQDINDNPPIFQDGPYSATVPEMANIGTSIIQVTATDADDPTYGNSARLVYTLVQGQQFFSVDPQTGILRTAVPDLDRETLDQHLVVLQAKDMGGHLGGLSGTTTVTVKLTDVNDNPPRFIQSVWSFSVSELAMPGVEVGRVSASDADLGENAELEYSILEGDSGDTFNISTSEREAIISLNKAVDYESRNSYSFSVEVLNPTVDPRFLRHGPFKDRASVRVAVLDADEPPRFSRARYRLDVTENCPPSCTVGRVSAVDPDTGLNSNIRFSIDPQSDPEALFRIVADSGLITTAMELDRERDQWHNLTIIATQRDSPNQVSRVEVSIETLDVNDNAPELDRQYITALCDSAAAGQVVQVVRAIDKDKGGNDMAVLFSIPPESRMAQNFTIRESGGPTASLVLLSPLHPLSRSPSSSLSLQVPLVLKDSMSGLISTGTVTVSVCPCLRGGARAGEKDRQAEVEWERETVCLPLPSSTPSPGLSTAALLAILACVATLMAVSALSLSLRRQKRDSLSPLEEDDVRENIITYDDEGGGEADTAAFDITALQSAPHSARRGYRTLDSRNISRVPQQMHDQAGVYGWVQSGGSLDPQYAGVAPPLYGRLCYSSHTLPVLRHAHSHVHGRGLAELACNFPAGPLDHSLIIQNKGADLGPLGPGVIYMGPAEPHADCNAPQIQDAPVGLDSGTFRGRDMKERGGASASEPEPRSQQDQDLDWNRSLPLTQTDPAPPLQGQSEVLPKDRTLVQTRQGMAGGVARSPNASSTLPSAGRRASRAGLSPRQGGAGAAESAQQGEPHRDYPGTLGRAGLGLGSRLGPGSGFMGARPEAEGGISLTGTTCGLYPEGAGLIVDWRDRAGPGGYPLGRRDMTPQLLPYPGQNRGMLGQLAYRGGWGLGLEAAGRGGANSLALRVGEFLRLRLAQVTFDPTQPPYDSVQIYGLEGEGSRAGSLSSLESEGEKEVEKEWGGGVEEWGPQFQTLAELFREREQEKEGEMEKRGEEERENDNKTEAEKEEEEEEKPGEEAKERDSEKK
ncbi:hypothetical protein AAFF_G00151750 [Aldrovandia affinis]|uniref:Cadherin domain-containing protein n=1 Tax=Aldrovandia affinis TaxID=143900 RepID=A0AAD7RP29_9TELE|nr:hypothetical protein AAFF_G00151750 [Aldrovandia affinis]